METGDDFLVRLFLGATSLGFAAFRDTGFLVLDEGFGIKSLESATLNPKASPKYGLKSIQLLLFIVEHFKLL